MKAFALLIAIFVSGFILGYAVRAMLSNARRARSFARYHRRIGLQPKRQGDPVRTYNSMAG